VDRIPMSDKERMFRICAQLCLRCGMFPQIPYGKLCTYCAAEDITKTLDRHLTILDRRAKQCEAA
jgi:hypothetical protein